MNLHRMLFEDRRRRRALTMYWAGFSDDDIAVRLKLTSLAVRMMVARELLKRESRQVTTSAVWEASNLGFAENAIAEAFFLRGHVVKDIIARDTLMERHGVYV